MLITYLAAQMKIQLSRQGELFDDFDVPGKDCAAREFVNDISLSRCYMLDFTRQKKTIFVYGISPRVFIHSRSICVL